jgi:hypothetical protein
VKKVERIVRGKLWRIVKWQTSDDGVNPVWILAVTKAL